MTDYRTFQNLGPQFGDGLYHGTHREIQGDHVLPAGQTPHGMVNFRGLSENTKAYATEDEDKAWTLATTGQRHTHANDNDPDSVPGRVRVHEVEPHEQMRVGSYHPDSPNFDQHYGENLAEWTAPKFKVKDTIDVKPGQQGTLPMNWNQFRKDPAAPPEWDDGYNHPDDEDIERGHRGGEMRKANDDRINLAAYQERVTGGRAPTGPPDLDQMELFSRVSRKTPEGFKTGLEISPRALP